MEILEKKRVPRTKRKKKREREKKEKEKKGGKSEDCRNLSESALFEELIKSPRKS